MCRSGDQGGRRCPASSGERRRARDAANTAVRRARAALAKATAAGDPEKITAAQERLNRAVDRRADLHHSQADTSRTGDTTPHDTGGPPFEAGPVGSIGHITATGSLTVIRDATGPVHIRPASSARQEGNR